jgi:hypothetical protein
LEQWCDDDWPLVEYKTETGMTRTYQPARKIYWTTVSAVLFLIRYN